MALLMQKKGERGRKQVTTANFQVKKQSYISIQTRELQQSIRGRTMKLEFGIMSEVTMREANGAKWPGTSMMPM